MQRIFVASDEPQDGVDDSELSTESRVPMAVRVPKRASHATTCRQPVVATATAVVADGDEPDPADRVLQAEVAIAVGSDVIQDPGFWVGRAAAYRELKGAGR